jgi:hypothetical protein
MSPFNLVKVRLQHNPALGIDSIFPMLRHMVKTEGLAAPFKGLPPRIIWTAPLASFSFIYYETLKSFIDQQLSKPAVGPTDDGGGAQQLGLLDDPDARKAVSMLVGGPVVLAVGIAIRTPFDIVEQYIQLGNKAAASGSSVVETAAVAAGESAAGRGSVGSAARKPLPYTEGTRAMMRAIYKTEGARGCVRFPTPSTRTHRHRHTRTRAQPICALRHPLCRRHLCHGCHLCAVPRFCVSPLRVCLAHHRPC